MKLTVLFKAFYNSEKAGGLILIIVTTLSLILANSTIGPEYSDLWQTKLGSHSIVHWINDGLMAIFFLLIGLELERELYHGELSNIKNASFPLIAAIGGFGIPAIVFLAFNLGTPTQAGAGIPMATDIAFAIGILSLLGSRVPSSLKIFLTALAVVDDLVAIIVIAIFYTKTLAVANLFIALGIFLLLLVFNKLKVRALWPYLIGGVIMWVFMYNSGVHATITGVLLAFAIPFGSGKKESGSYKLLHILHKPAAFIILPLFAIANTCIAIPSGWHTGLTTSNGIGIIVGLVLGKPLGVFVFAYLGTVLGLSSLPPSLRWSNILGVGFLAGIGFTMSIFITILAYNDIALINNSKIAIMVASLCAAVLGYFSLQLTLKNTANIN
jgi:NhaA family Na+:H+ antiporter